MVDREFIVAADRHKSGSRLAEPTCRVRADPTSGTVSHRIIDLYLVAGSQIVIRGSLIPHRAALMRMTLRETKIEGSRPAVSGKHTQSGVKRVALVVKYRCHDDGSCTRGSTAERGMHMSAGGGREWRRSCREAAGAPGMGRELKRTRREDGRERARRDRNYPTRNSSLPISAEIIKRGEGTRSREGYAGKGGRTRDRIEGGAGVALLKNDGSTGKRR